jgi:hypothetical protein
MEFKFLSFILYSVECDSDVRLTLRQTGRLTFGCNIIRWIFQLRVAVVKCEKLPAKAWVR